MNIRLLHALQRARHAVFAVLAVVTVVLGYQSTSTQFDNTLETYFLDADIADYNRFLDVFGSDEFIALAFADDDVFSAESLALVRSLSRQIKPLPHVRRVMSLTESQVVHGDDDTVYFENLDDAVARADAPRAVRRRLALDDRIMPGTLVSPDGRYTAVVAEIDHIVGAFDYKVELLERLRAIARQAEADSGKHIRMSGTAVLDDALFRQTQRDQQTFMPVVILLIALSVLLAFRSWRVLMMVLAIVGLTLTWTYGTLVLLGYKINIVSTIIPPLLLAVAIADALHLVADYLQERNRAGVTDQQALEFTWCNVFPPCVMTTATTVAGLLSLLAADLAPIREFGLVAALGAIYALIHTVAMMPLLPWVARGTRVQGSAVGPAWLDAVLRQLGQWSRRRAMLVLAAGVLVTAAAGALLPRLSIGTNSLDYFREDDIARVDTEWVDRHIGGSASLEFHVDGGHEGALKEPELLRRIVDFQHYLTGLVGVTGVYSPADLVISVNQAFTGDAVAVIPDSKPLISQQLVLVEGSDELRSLVSDDFSQGRISARVALDRSQELAALTPEILTRMQRTFPGTDVRATGLVYLMHRMEHYLLTSQIKSFGLAFAVVSVAMGLMLRSWILGFAAAISNASPILITLGLMPLLGLQLDVATVMIAAVILGLIVDDTIHYLSRWRSAYAAGGDARGAIAEAMRGVGRPIVLTSGVLCAGFLVLNLASFNPIIHFGQLAALAIALALLADLVLLPALLGFLGRARPRDVPG